LFGSDELYSAVNVSAVTTLLDADTTTSSGKALYADSRIPQSFTGNKSINFYMAYTYNPKEYEEYRYTIHCRAKTYLESIAIAYAVLNEIHRVNYTGYYIYCSVLATISPADDTDNYNTPVEALIKKR
jgi:hypothetical protein